MAKRNRSMHRRKAHRTMPRRREIGVLKRNRNIKLAQIGLEAAD
jgi:hypothetical protein